MKLRIKALRSLCLFYDWRSLWGLFLEAECDCSQCDGDIPQFDHRFDPPPREVPCLRCAGRGTEPARERNLTQLLFDPEYLIARLEARRELRDRIEQTATIAEGVM